MIKVINGNKKEKYKYTGVTTTVTRDGITGSLIQNELYELVEFCNLDDCMYVVVRHDNNLCVVSLLEFSSKFVKN